MRPIFVHCKPDAGYDTRFDTVLMVNGSIAVLNRVTQQLLGHPGLAIDESYPGPNLDGREREFVFGYICEEVERSLTAGEEPAVYCTLLSYNACSSLELLRKLKRQFGSRLRTGVGGALVGFATNAYRRAPFIDQVAVGDAETCLGAMLAGVPFVAGRKHVLPQDHYVAPLYDENYLGLSARLDDMSRYTYGPLTGIRQLITESVRGCSWAYTTSRVCDFCSVYGVEEDPIFRDLHEHFAIERELVEKQRVNWIFDVGSQWLPVMGPAKQVAWLKEYIAARKRYDAPDLNRYVYLTVNSVTEETVPLLREAGVTSVFIGIDGWDAGTKRAMHKTLAPHERALDACRANGVTVRTAVVVGSGLTPANLDTLPRFVEDMMRRYAGDTLIAFSTYMQIVLPGSPEWSRLRCEAFNPLHRDHPLLREIAQLYLRFESVGYLTTDEQTRLAELRIRHTQQLVDYEAVVEAQKAAAEAVRRSEAMSITYFECEKLEKP